MPMESTRFEKGHVPFNKGKHGLAIAWNKGTHTTNSGSFKSGHKMMGTSIGEIMKGKPSIRKGTHQTEEAKEKISIAKLGCTAWNKGLGDKTPENKRIWRSVKMRQWREAVFARDDWTCQKYGVRGGALRPHHILNFAEHPELRFAIDNGITLSNKAHREFHDVYGNRHNTREQLVEFLSDGFVIGQNT